MFNNSFLYRKANKMEYVIRALDEGAIRVWWSGEEWNRNLSHAQVYPDKQTATNAITTIPNFLQYRSLEVHEFREDAKFGVGQLVHWNGLPSEPFAGEQDVTIDDVTFDNSKQAWVYSFRADNASNQQLGEPFNSVPESNIEELA